MILRWCLIVCLVGACGSDDAPSVDASATGDDGSLAVIDAAAEDLDMQSDDFECIRDWSKVGKFYITNKLGHLTESLNVANSQSGGTYPVGTIIQLIPQEAMVKRRAGWNTTANDWEFFSLSVSGVTTSISDRGVDNVVNQLGGNCFDCHSKAASQWDFVCETSHGCDPLGISDAFIESLQNNDSRCN